MTAQIPEFNTFRAALRARLTDPSEIASLDLRPSLSDPGYTDVYLNDHRLTVAPTQIHAAASSDGWDILAAGSLTRLRNRHSLVAGSTLSIDELHQETARTLERILRAVGRDDLLIKSAQSCIHISSRAYSAAYMHELAYALIALLDEPPLQDSSDV